LFEERFDEDAAERCFATGRGKGDSGRHLSVDPEFGEKRGWAGIRVGNLNVRRGRVCADVVEGDLVGTSEFGAI